MNLAEIRKQLHKIPELGFEEKKTNEFILSKLQKYSELKVHTFDFPGILAEYKVNDDDFKLFRADMDGLPISEKTNCRFKSEHLGMMHACGHDMHMTILLGLIERVIQEQPEQNVLFLFQPAEEGRGGAKRILETGVFREFSIDETYALHVTDEFPTGTISTKPGIFFANTQELEVEFIGKSAHVAFPENGKDAIAAASEFYLDIQKRLNKKYSENKRVICAFGKFNGGTAMNAVAEKCKLDGTFRAFSEADHHKLKNFIEKTAEDIAQKYQLEHRINYLAYYKEVVNDKDLFYQLEDSLKDSNVEIERSEKVFTGEDFGFFTDKYRGILFWLGCRKAADEKNGLHSTKFLPDEKALKIGVEIFWELLRN